MLFLLLLKQIKTMFPKIIKLILATAALALAVYQFVDGEIGNGIFAIVLAGMFVLLYFKNEIIFLIKGLTCSEFLLFLGPYIQNSFGSDFIFINDA